jgi:hypothetical protein
MEAGGPACDALSTHVGGIASSCGGEFKNCPGPSATWEIRTSSTLPVNSQSSHRPARLQPVDVGNLGALSVRIDINTPFSYRE